MADFFLDDLPTYLPNSNHMNKMEESKANIHTEINMEKRDIKEDDDESQSLVTKKDDKKDIVCIPGTNITLETEEDIAKWIEERKKKWPSSKNVELKKRKEAEKRSSEYLDDTETNSARILNKPKDGNGRDVKRAKNVCRFYQQHKRCKFGIKCKNAHITENSTSTLNSNTKLINNIEVSIPQRFKNVSKDSSLFSKLVKRDQAENENELILDFILFLNDKKLIDYNLSI